MSEITQTLATAVAALLATGNAAHAFRLDDGREPAIISDKMPRPPLLGQFPQLYCTWSARRPQFDQVARPLIGRLWKVEMQVRAYVSDVSRVFQIEDTRELVDKVAEYLQTSRTLSGAVLDMDVVSVTGDAEALFNRGVIAHGLVEFWALADLTVTVTT